MQKKIVWSLSWARCGLRYPKIGGLVLFGLVAVAIAVPSIAWAITPADRTVQVSATIIESPATIKLSWPADPNATGYTVARRLLTDANWGSPTNVVSTTNAYTDTSVTVGQDYEYKITKNATSYTGYGYINSAIKLPLVENRGTVILVVDNTYAADLAGELDRLKSDLVGDGWKVIRHDVARNAGVPSVKALIKADYTADPLNVKAVFLFGHVPVPYSGQIAPDGHSDHVGAWPADGFYGDMSGNWTDTAISTTTPSRAQNRNIPGDGKYDQSIFPVALKLEVGRVDLADMPAFAPKTEKDLLRQYLNKDHNFRHKLITAEPRALIDDTFGDFSGEAFSSNGWRNFAPLVGANNVKALDWFGTLSTQSYLWAYGSGAGSYTSANGVGNTSSFAMTDTKTVFTMLFGSYFGDWDSTNNFLRAPLATTSYGLTSSWAGRPYWFYQHMGLGKTIGYSTRLTQNANFSGLYTPSYAASYIHVALMGDPTLRMTPLAPAGAFTATALPTKGVNLSWNASPEAGGGYHVYRANNPAGPFTRLTATPITATGYQDANAVNETYTYMVRAIRLETTPSGSYYNASQGVFSSVTAPCQGLLVTHQNDDSSCGSLRYAVNYINSAAPPSPVIKVDLPDGQNVLNLTDSLTLPAGVTLLGGLDESGSCSGGPALTLQGNNTGGTSLILGGDNQLSGVRIRGLGGPQLKSTQSSAGPNRLTCLIITG